VKAFHEAPNTKSYGTAHRARISFWKEEARTKEILRHLTLGFRKHEIEVLYIARGEGGGGGRGKNKEIPRHLTMVFDNLP
jgi:hypothetical protein